MNIRFEFTRITRGEAIDKLVGLHLEAMARDGLPPYTPEQVSVLRLSCERDIRGHS